MRNADVFLPAVVKAYLGNDENDKWIRCGQS